MTVARRVAPCYPVAGGTEFPGECFPWASSSEACGIRDCHMLNAAAGDGRMDPAVHVDALCIVSLNGNHRGGSKANLLALCGTLRELPFGAEK